MTRAQAGRTGGSLRRLVGWVFRLALALVLLVGWTTWELHGASTRAQTRLQDVTATAGEQLNSFLGRLTAVFGQFGPAQVAVHNRMSVTVGMLKVEPALAPAQSLFVYDAAGHFIAANVPLLPGDANVSGRGWFEVAATHAKGPLFMATPAAPLGQGAGFVITRTITNRAGGVAGIIGTFIRAKALRALITPASLSPGATVTLAASGQAKPLLSFTVGTAVPRPLLANALEWIGEAPRPGEIADIPGGFSLRIDADVFADITIAERRTVLAHGAALLLALAVLLWLFRPRYRPGLTVPEGAPGSQPAPELEWGWEIDSRGRLVGVAGNAPMPLLSAVGSNFLDLIADDGRAKELREAIAGRMPVQDLELSIILPGKPRAAARRFRVSGRFVADTGGFWGTAEAVEPLEPVTEAAD